MSGDGEITPGKRRLIQKRQRRPSAFTKAKQAAFFAAMAESCNVRRSAAQAGVSYGTVYLWRRNNLEFRTRWEDALAHGYAALEAGLLERAREAVGEIGPVESAPVQVGTMDAKLAFSLLQNHERNRGKAPGDVHQRRGDIDKVIERLEKALKRFAPDAAEPATGDRAA